MSISSAPAGAGPIPIIDVQGLASDDGAKRAAVAAAIRHAGESYGFLYVRGHGVDPSLVREMFQQAQRFFALPLEAKMALDKTRSPINRGYEPVAGQRLEEGTPPDLKESFFLGEDLPADHPRVMRRQFGSGANQWPDLPGFRSVVETYQSVLKDVGGRLFEGLALSLELDGTYFDRFYTEPMNILRLIHYPTQPANPLPGQKGCGAHTDFGGLTVLAQDANGGLQVFDRGRGWIDAAPVPETFVVNLGDFVARWTNDRYNSTLHRVINTSGRERYSIPFFTNGNADYEVSCIPTCLQPGEQPKYALTTIARHFTTLYAKTAVG